MDQTSINVIVSYANTYKVPPWIPLCIAWAETGINPNAIGDNGTSFGLFQLHIDGGQGDAYTTYGTSPDVMLDPAVNAEIGIPPIASAYRNAACAGLSGFDLLVCVAEHSGHPCESCNVYAIEPAYVTRLQQAYAVAQQNRWFDIGSASSPGTPSQAASTVRACPELGVYMGSGTAANVQPGLNVYGRTISGTFVTYVTPQNSCTAMATYRHTRTPPGSGTPGGSFFVVGPPGSVASSSFSGPPWVPLLILAGAGGIIFVAKQWDGKKLRRSV